MKKVLLILAVAGVMVSCNSKKKDGDKKPADEKTNTNTGDNGNTNTNTTAGTPTFADAEVQKFVDDYTAYVNAIVDAYKAKDASKIADLSGKMQDWSSRTTSVGMKLANNPDDAKKFTDYMTKLSKDMQAAMMPQ